MNFLIPPRSKVTPTQKAAAMEIIDELIQLGALKLAQPGHLVPANGALSTVPKAGQSRHFRVISHMKIGGQNECIGQDLVVFLGKAESILPQLYLGGYSAVANVNFSPARRNDTTSGCNTQRQESYFNTTVCQWGQQTLPPMPERLYTLLSMHLPPGTTQHCLEALLPVTYGLIS
jgi:hypothetical protein